MRERGSPEGGEAANLNLAGLAGKRTRRALKDAAKAARTSRKVGRDAYKRARGSARARAYRRAAELRAAQLRAERHLAQVAREQGPIIAGPWLGEIGYELLYWIPMLRWAEERYGIDPARVVAFSRGGVESWYGGISESYADVFDYRSPDEVKARHTQTVADTGMQKQRDLSEFDQELLAQAGADHGLKSWSVLHPSILYDLFRGSFGREGWQGRLPLSEVTDRTSFAGLRPPSGPPPLRLPREYVAVKAYFRDSFPDTEANHRFLHGLLEGLTQTTHVVLLSAGMSVDEHVDYLAAASDRIHTLDGLLAPRDNLALQTRVIAGARALISTYGGLSYLAPMLGVPAVAFYSEASGLQPVHLEVANRANRAVGSAGLLYVSVDDAAALASALAQREP